MPTAPTPNPVDPTDPRALQSERDRALLNRFSDFAVDFLENLANTASPAESLAEKLSRARAFERIASAVRRCILLAQKCADITFQANHAAPTRSIPGQHHPKPNPDQGLGPERGDAVETLGGNTDALERPERLDSIADLEDRPIAEVLAKLCQEAGIPIDAIGLPEPDPDPEPAPQRRPNVPPTPHFKNDFKNDFKSDFIRDVVRDLVGIHRRPPKHPAPDG